MADKKKKTEAEKAASARSKSASTKKKQTEKTSEPLFSQLPVRFISAAVCFILFVLFLTVFLWPDNGWFAIGFRTFVMGLIGQVSFYVAVPGLLYLFCIQAFSGKRPVKMRSICMICFILLCGCISQLTYAGTTLPSGLSLLSFLYEGGSQGYTAGLICGSIALLLKGASEPLAWVILSVAAALTLLASFQITIPSVIRAVQNRPRADWEDEEKKEVAEPAAVVVNHIANKRIEYVENKRQRQAEQDQLAQDTPADVPAAPAKRKKTKADDFMSRIDEEVDTPVGAASEPVSDDTEVDVIIRKNKPSEANIEKLPTIPAEMPELVKTETTVAVQEPPMEPVSEPVTEPVQVLSDKPVEEPAKKSDGDIEIPKIPVDETPAVQEYCYPPVELLMMPSKGAQDGTTEMRENTRRLNETLASFKVEAHVIDVTRGPSVTRYEVELERGVRFNKLTSVADDIALNLGAPSVRIAAVPGKISVVGIEVPNRTVNMVSLREVIDSPEFRKSKSKSSFAVGKDIGGSCIIGNIAKLPHMLIAGTTGSGKSVCMNSIIISLLYKSGPEDVKIIMIDPKMVELGIYNGIPHLLIPVVTDPKKAAGSLQWAVNEMMRRYKIMSDAGVRDLESYNSIVETEEEGQKLPQVVVIIDELADLMLVAAKEVEESICRIAQMGRAAGIHLVIATQRPSADVITGLMKANIPSRIAFSVASAMESRIILDTQGAEKLVGRGDMLFSPIGMGKPVRVQGCYVSDEEVEAVATYVKDNYMSAYDAEIMDDIDRRATQTGSNGKATAADPEPNPEELDGDEMLTAAVDVFMETGQASVSMLQRRLKLGYARAARIVDEMQEKGIVGPFQGSKPRTILVTKEQWEAMKAGQPAQMNMDDLTDSDPSDEDPFA